MVPAHFMGEDGYGSFASLDADLLRLPNNSGNGGLSLVYNTVREPDDFTVASSCPHQPLSTVTPPCMTVGIVGGMVGAGTRTLTTSPPGPTAHPQSVSRQATCAVSPTGFGATASPAKPTDAHQRDHMDTTSLRAPSANRKDMEDRIVMFMMSKHGGNCAHKVDQNKKGPNRICQKCTGDDCTFCVVATQKQSVWAVDFRNSSFVHHGGCCSRGAPKFSMRLSTVRCVRSAVLACKTITKAHEGLRGGSLASWFVKHGFRSPNLDETSTYSKSCRRLCNRIFQVDERGLNDALEHMQGYVDAFNSIDANGEATLHTRRGIKKNQTVTKRGVLGCIKRHCSIF